MKTPFQRLALIILAALLLLTGCAGPEAPAQPTATAAAAAAPQRGTKFYFDTVVSMTIYGAPAGTLDEVWAICQRYENLLSKTVPGSDVDRINQANGQSVQVDPETFAILQRAQEISRMTGGAFSVSLAPVISLWDFTGGTEHIPPQAEVQAALAAVGDAAITLGANNTVTLNPGMSIDLGGVAKGYIADKLAEFLRGRASGAVISLGGNVYVTGQKPDGSLYKVGIQNPDGASGSLRGVISVTEASVVTSGIYERKFEKNGVLYHHIIDPETGFPSGSDLASATIVSECSMDADAMATALIVMGKDKALAFMQEHDIQGVLITRDGRLISQQTKDTFQLEVLKDDLNH